MVQEAARQGLVGDGKFIVMEDFSYREIDCKYLDPIGKINGRGLGSYYVFKRTSCTNTSLNTLASEGRMTATAQGNTVVLNVELMSRTNSPCQDCCSYFLSHGN